MKIIKYICFGWVIVTLMSCEKYLEPKITNDYGDDITWKLPEYAMGILGDAYAFIDQNVCAYRGSGNNYSDAVTDNSLTTHTASSLYDYVFGSQTPMSDPISFWDVAYDAIALTNLFLEKGLSPNLVYDISDEPNNVKYRNRSKGEAYFLRAWWQHELLRNFGGLSDDGKALGYVIAVHTFDSEESEKVNALPRNTFEECVQQIMNDCDTAFKYLPLQYSNANDNDPAFGVSHLGRASGKAAIALKSRVALLGASPAYQPKGAFALSNDEVRKKWLRAAVVAQDALTKMSATLANMLPLTNALIVGDAVNTPADANSYAEMLFFRFANQRVHEQHHYPPMWFGQGKCNPSQNLVNAYPMANGYPITHPNSGYDPQKPYSDRDRRFVSTFNYNGGIFCEIPRPTTDERWEYRPLEIWSSAADGTVGCDALEYDYRNTWTGYYLRKGMSGKANINYNPDNPGNTNNDYHRNPLLRRCEVWFNLAEALNEYSGPKDALNDPVGVTANTPDAIIKRLRALYNTGTKYVDEVADEGMEAFRNLILNERRIEFSFENMRLWDIRRWKLPQLSEPILGIRIYNDVKWETEEVENPDDPDGAPITRPKRIDRFVYFGTNPNDETDKIVVQSREALAHDRYYTSPIPYSEMVKNPNLVQNAGWK